MNYWMFASSDNSGTVPPTGHPVATTAQDGTSPRARVAVPATQASGT